MLLAVRRQLVHSRHRIATTAPSSSKSPTCLFKTRGRNLGTSSSNGNGHNGGQVPAVTPTAMCKAGGIGVVAGVFGSLVGMGGAFVLIPALTGLLKFSQHQAHGTSLAAVVATGSGGAISYASAGAVDWEAALYVAGLGMMTAHMGAVVSGRLSAATLQRLCGVFQVIVAPTVPLRNEILAFFGGNEEGKGEGKKEGIGGASDEQNDWTRRLQLMSIGAGSGFLAGLFGVGGGAVTIPALTMCLEMSHYQALGTSLAAMVPTALVGTHSYHAQGHVVWSFVAPLAVGSLCGSFLGGKEIAMQIPENYLKWGFGIMMVVLGSKTIYSAGPLKSMALPASKAK